MLKGRKAIAAAAAPVVLGASAIAYAAVSDVGADKVEAEIVFTHVQGRERACEGPGGQAILEQHVRARGTSTGVGDAGARYLDGDVLYQARVLIDFATGAAMEEGVIRFREAGSRAWTAQGRAALAEEVLPQEALEGTIVGEVRDPGADSPSGRLIANVDVFFHDNFSVTAEVGGTEEAGPRPATVFRGACTGPYERFEFDIPAPGQGQGLTARGGSERRGWNLVAR